MSVGLLDKETLCDVLIGRAENATDKKMSKLELETKRAFFDAMWDTVYVNYIEKLHELGADPDMITKLGMTFIASADAASNFLGQMGAEAAALSNEVCPRCDSEYCPMAIKIREDKLEDPKGTRIDIE